MKCAFQNCPGEYEPRLVLHAVRHRGRVIVIDNVPAEVCPACGDVLLAPETVRRIEAMLGQAAEPAASAPLLQYVA